MQKLLFSTLLIFSTAPALAHHPLNGMPMETFGQGVLSGVGHPLLGFDHLLFVIAAGVLALLTRQRAISILAYVAAMIAGCLLMIGGFDLNSKEALIALSLLVVGGVLMMGRGGNTGVCLVLLAGFGLFHGSAFGESIVAQEVAAGTQVVLGYLIGLGVLQALVAWNAGSVLAWIAGYIDNRAIQTRLVGALVAGAGVFLTLETIENVVIGVLSFGS